MHHKFVVYSAVMAILLFTSLTQIPATTTGTWRSDNGAEQSGFLIPSSFTPHAPITIIGDQNFTDTALTEGWQGDGSPQNPFVIDSLGIDRGGVAGHCISISNTRVNFTIRNCNLTGASVASGSGIYLWNTTSGIIINNNCSGNRNGILLESGSNYHVISNNTFNANTQGIHIWISNHTTVENNDCDGNGHGILLEGAERNQLIRNRINDSAWSGIYLIDASFNAIANNTCQNNHNFGIHIFSTHYVDVVNNICKGNTWVGIHCQESYSLTITNNTCEGNQRGFDMGDMSADNIIRWNILESNTDMNGYDGTGGSNYISHNYWSDYVGVDANGDGIGDTPHLFPDTEDPYPLIYYPTPPRWVSKPHDITVEESEGLFHAYYEAIAPAPLTWWISDGVHFNLSGDGHLSSKYVLETITYNLRIVVSNIYGVSISVEFSIGVIEHIPPSWMFTPHTQILEYNEAFEYYVAAIDPSGIGGWFLNDSVHFILTEYYYEGGSTARLTNASVLDPGSYTLNISVFDSHHNKLSSVFEVIIRQPPADTTSPSWIIASLTETLEFGEPFSKQMSAWDESNVDHYWISDTINFAIDGSGLIRNATILEIGVYSLEVRAYDPFGNFCSATLIITVISPIPTSPSLDPLITVALAAGMGIGVVAMAAIFFFLKWRRTIEKT
jgi:parallel beta-helix repeat protein